MKKMMYVLKVVSYKTFEGRRDKFSVVFFFLLVLAFIFRNIYDNLMITTFYV